jgi:hypothetical protein
VKECQVPIVRVVPVALFGSTLNDLWVLEQPRSKLKATGQFTCVYALHALHACTQRPIAYQCCSAAFDISRETPSLASMRRYKSIIVSLGGAVADLGGAEPSELTFHNAVALGNRLADYVDEGYGVVISGTKHVTSSLFLNHGTVQVPTLHVSLLADS